jgi:DNA-binding response OmpR family regulator
MEPNMQTCKILIAEDDPHIRTGLIDVLEGEGYTVLSASDGKQALDIFRKQPPDLILLDIMMPQISGFDVCRAIRKENTHVPIIMLTAKGEEIDKVVGLELGADDYITKPFGVRELLARITAVLRRSRQEKNHDTATKDIPDTFKFGQATIDRKTYTAICKGKKHPLTARELKLLEIFYNNPNHVLSRDELLNAAWGVNYYGTTRTLDQHIAQLRKKIETDTSAPAVIQTIHGIGYRYGDG